MATGQSPAPVDSDAVGAEYKIIGKGQRVAGYLVKLCGRSITADHTPY